MKIDKDLIKSVVNECMKIIFQTAEANYAKDEELIAFAKEASVNLLGNTIFRLTNEAAGISYYQENAKETIEALQEWFNFVIQNKIKEELQ